MNCPSPPILGTRLQLSAARAAHGPSWITGESRRSDDRLALILQEESDVAWPVEGDTAGGLAASSVLLYLGFHVGALMSVIDESGAVADLLRGVKVVDFTQALSGPYCTLMLADLGADVVKVEPPGRGDDSRHWGPPFLGNDSTYFLSVNRNKRSAAIDLKTTDGLNAAKALIADADVVVENWRTGTADRLGIG